MSRSRANADDVLALNLARGATVAEAAAAAGVSVRTVHRRLSDPGFVKEVSRLRGRMVTEAAGRLADALSEAGTVLRLLVRSDNERTALAACQALLDNALRVRQADELEQRLQALEEAEAARQDPRTRR
jgi:hypothetical protein